jgi:hypothetical protein
MPGPEIARRPPPTPATPASNTARSTPSRHPALPVQLVSQALNSFNSPGLVPNLRRSKPNSSSRPTSAITTASILLCTSSYEISDLHTFVLGAPGRACTGIDYARSRATLTPAKTEASAHTYRFKYTLRIRQPDGLNCSTARSTSTRGASTILDAGEIHWFSSALVAAGPFGTARETGPPGRQWRRRWSRRAAAAGEPRAAVEERWCAGGHDGCVRWARPPRAATRRNCSAVWWNSR